MNEQLHLTSEQEDILRQSSASQEGYEAILQVVQALRAQDSGGQLEETKRESERLLAILENTPDFVGIATADGRLEFMNRAARKMTGLSPEGEINQFSFAQLTADWAMDLILHEAIPTAIREGAWQGEAGVKSLDGREIPVSQVVMAQKSPDGQLQYLATVIRDMTEEAKIREQINYQARLLQEISDAVISVDRDFKVVSWNKAAEGMYGYTADDVLGRNINDLIKTVYEGFAEGEAWQLLQEQDSLSTRAYQKNHAGRELIVSTSMTKLHDESGGTIGFVAVNRDITELEATRREAQRLQAILENTTDFVGVATADGAVQFLNRSARKMMGLSPKDDLKQYNLTQFAADWATDLIAKEAIPTAIQTGAWQGEAGIKSLDGKEIPVSQVIMAQRAEDGELQYLATIVRDISERKRQEQVLLKRQKIIERQSELSLKLSSRTVLRQGLHVALREITEEAVRTVGVARASVWSYHPEQKSIRLLNLYEHSSQNHIANDLTFDAQNATSFLEALTRERMLVVDDVYTHDSTGDLIDIYLKPTGMTSLLGATVHAGGQIRGIVLLECTSEKRHWTLDEQSFTSFLADLTGLLFEAEDRRMIRDERQRLVDVLENTTDFVGIVDPQGRILFMNRAGRDMVGIDQGRVRSLTLRDITPERAHETLIDDINHEAEEQGVWEGEFAIQGVQGEIPVSMVIVSQKDNDGTVISFSAIARDITEQKLVEDQARLRLKFGQALSDAQTEQDVLDIIAHEIGDYLQASMHITRHVEQGDETAEYVIHQMSFDESVELLPIGAKLQLDSKIHAQLERGEPFVTNNLRIDKRLTRNMQALAEAMNIAGMAIAPMNIQDQWFGNLIAFAAQPDFFDDSKLELFHSLGEQGVIALRGVQLNEQIQQSLNRRSRQVQLTTQIAQQIASATKLHELYQLIAQLTKEEFGYYHTQLLQYNPVKDRIELIAGYGEIGQRMLDLGHYLPMGIGLIGTAAQRGESVLTADVRKDENWKPHPLLPETHGELAVPIKFGREVLGVLDIQSNIPGQLTEEDRLVFEGLCGQIGMAIRSTRLQESLDAQLEELNNLQRLMSREAWATYRSQGQQTGGYLFDQITVRPIDDDVQSTNGAATSSTESTFLLGDDTQTVTRPISILGEVVGMIGVQATDEDPIDKADQNLLAAISTQVAEALENARLLEQTQKRAVELEAVARVSATSSANLEVDQLLSSMVDLTKTSFGLYHTHVYLYDEVTNRLVLTASAGDIGSIMVAEGHRVPLSDQNSLVARATNTTQGLIIPDLQQEPGFLPNPLLPAARSELLVPMRAGEILLGVLELQSDEPYHFTSDDVGIHTTLANQLAIALQNASLYEEQLDTAERLREVDHLKSQFLASMSHELRTPLNSIIGFADVLLEGIDGELNDRMREDVLLIRDGGQHLRALIGDILDMTKIEAGMMDLTYSAVELERVAVEVSATTQGLLKDKPVKFQMQMDEELSIMDADRTRLVQILLNLLSNAAKFTDEGAINLKITKHGDDVLFMVKDTGIGIKEENISQVFEQFRQIGGMEERKAGGTGLGMPITKQLVELHGGEIWLESIYGVGTTFWFTLPMQRPEDTIKRKEYYA